MILTADFESGWRESHQQEFPLPSFLREDARRSAAASSPPSCSRDEDAARLPPPDRKKWWEKKKRSENAFGPVEGFFPRLSLLSGSPNVASHASVSSFQTVGCIMRSEMLGGRFAVMIQANQRLPSLDVQAWPQVFWGSIAWRMQNRVSL